MIYMIDIDGVIANFEEAAKKYCLDKFDKELTFESYGLTPPLTQEEFNTLMLDADYFSSFSVYAGAKEGIDALKDRGHFILLVTARVIASGHTLNWLYKNNIYFDKFVKLTEIGRKKYLQQNKVGALVDDCFSTIVECSSYCKTFLMDRNWNHFYNPTTIRIYSLSELVNYLED